MHTQHLQRLRPGAARRSAHSSAAQPGGAHGGATRSVQQPSRRGAAPRSAAVPRRGSRGLLGLGACHCQWRMSATHHAKCCPELLGRHGWQLPCEV